MNYYYYQWIVTWFLLFLWTTWRIIHWNRLRPDNVCTIISSGLYISAIHPSQQQNISLVHGGYWPAKLKYKCVSSTPHKANVLTNTHNRFVENGKHFIDKFSNRSETLQLVIAKINRRIIGFEKLLNDRGRATNTNERSEIQVNYTHSYY